MPRQLWMSLVVRASTRGYCQPIFEIDGIDFESQFVEIARAKNPGGNFSVADMRAFPTGETLRRSAVLLQFNRILLTPQDIVAALTCFRARLTPGGVILVEPWLSVAPVLRNEPLNICTLLLMSAIVTIPFHSTSNETVARMGATGGIAGYIKAGPARSPSPWVTELARSWSS